jgi:hypothetical protein
MGMVVAAEKIKTKYHTLGTVSKSNKKIDTNSTHMYDHSLFWLGKNTSI